MDHQLFGPPPPPPLCQCCRQGLNARLGLYEGEGGGECFFSSSVAVLNQRARTAGGPGSQSRARASKHAARQNGAFVSQQPLRAWWHTAVVLCRSFGPFPRSSRRGCSSSFQVSHPPGPG
ncbi:hypothetical protein LX36DRAFT_320658 [Colletotrichum falcatum]|nr:hypothetical protein LX36DRAFT_320658 [Colletotrichum falcatum]